MHVIMYRGLPGSGKSYLIQKLTQDMSNFKIHSADSYRYVNGVYKFDPKTDTGHTQCFRAYIDDLSHYVRLPEEWPDFTLIVDNTNTAAWELAPYMLAAATFGCTSEIRTVWCDPAIAARRNKHSVPFDVILKMYRNLLTQDLPPFWKHTVVENPSDE